MAAKLKTYLLLTLLLGGWMIAASTLLPDEVTAAEIRAVPLAETINPAISEYLSEQIDQANRNGARALIIMLDTPGGLDTAMREIIQSILASEVPVVVYVAPAGARAASAGALITLAADIAAMAPGTNIGAAHPVSLGWPSGGEGGEESVGMTKALNDAVAYARSLADQRGRNADWAAAAVRDSVSAPAREALQLHVVDLIAVDLADLLHQLDGRSYFRGGKRLTLQTTGAEIVRSEMTLRQQVLNALANPNVAYLLLMLGALGIFFEISQPGVILPGVLGTIALLLAFYALHALPVNYVGILLILVGMILFLLEVKVVSYGMLAVGGVVALLLGSTMLIRTDDPAMKIATGVIVATSLVLAGLMTLVVYLVARTQRSTFVTGVDALLGAEGEVASAAGEECRVFVRGEYWFAGSELPLAPRMRVRVTGVRPGMRLLVEPLDSDNQPDSETTEGEGRC